MKRIAFFCCLFSLSYFVSCFAFAHLDAGEDRMVGDYLVDFGYSPERVVAGVPANIAFNLVDPETQQNIEPAQAWVRISSEAVIFAGTLAPEAEHIALTYTFPESGKYKVKVRFKDVKGAVLAETDFDLEVHSSEVTQEKKSFWQRFWGFLKFW